MFRMATRCWTILVPLAVAACSGVSADWIKPGASEAQVKADNAACRSEAELAYGRTADITRDIQVSRPPSISDVGNQSARLRDYDTERDYDKVFDTCMAAHGYSRRGDDR
jgi:hypothetical protein